MRSENENEKMNVTDKPTAPNGAPEDASPESADAQGASLVGKMGKAAGASFLLPSVAVGVTIALTVGSYQPFTFDAASIAQPQRADAVELETVEVASEKASDVAAEEAASAPVYSKADYGVDTSHLKDGVYTGSGQGFRSTITVRVTVSGGKIAAVEVVSEGDDEPYFSNARGVISSVVASQSMGVDAVSGATYSSRGILVAIANALSSASGGVVSADDVTVSPEGEADGATPSPAPVRPSSPDDTDKPSSADGAEADDAPAHGYADGTFVGKGFGYKSTIEVAVTVKDGKIETLDIVSQDDDARYFSKAKALLPEVIDRQTTKVDTVTGATFSSMGILDAVDDALAQSAKEADEKAAASSGAQEGEDGSGKGNAPDQVEFPVDAVVPGKKDDAVSAVDAPAPSDGRLPDDEEPSNEEPQGALAALPASGLPEKAASRG